ncbi:hypothetical protein SAMN05216323_101015 [Williamwhitmania taraxaci]|uniref:Uncharacterized protein n=2 Tax=Williamwhitmania taraxaci TaxID=1640674 RepID=A0A1G6HEW7_9BACT|nr:hypothetical protein SAMN05216323_101015 [Williamwhitmania taraxaci]
MGLILLATAGCKKEDGSTVMPRILLKNGAYTQNEQFIPVGGKLTFGITATDGNAIITNIKIQRIADGVVITELDQGVYIPDGGLDRDFTAYKSSATKEIWRFLMLNSNRDSAVTTLTVNLGAGSAYGEIYHYPSVKIGMQGNPYLPNYLDLHTGNLYSKTNVSGHEGDIDLVGFVYTTSGILSPTLCCPGYTGSSSVTGHYPEIASWSQARLTAYDYGASDNNLISSDKFDRAQNDSLLVMAFNPQSVSGLCKFCNTGKVIPFKTEDGKFGLIKVLHADLSSVGYMELDIKIQK